MNKAASVKSSSASSDTNSEKGIILSFFSWSVIYKLCNRIPLHRLWAMFRIFNIFCMFALSIDPEYAWGPKTKSVLQIVHTIFRGPFIIKGGSYTTVIIMESITLGILAVSFAFIWGVLRNEHSKGTILVLVQIVLLVIAQVIGVSLGSILTEPWKCNFSTGRLLYFPEQECFKAPNLIFFITSFFGFISLFFQCVIRYFL